MRDRWLVWTTQKVTRQVAHTCGTLSFSHILAAQKSNEDNIPSTETSLKNAKGLREGARVAVEAAVKSSSVHNREVEGLIEDDIIPDTSVNELLAAGVRGILPKSVNDLTFLL